jgi:DNA primase catalytic core
MVMRANELALRFFVEQLDSPEGQQARSYLESRGINRATAERFDIGYAPADGQALQRYLASRGITRELMVKAGLAHAGGRDLFVQRVMFAVRDVTGRVVGFGGRALNDDEPAKYINSPDTPVFKKGQALYALHLARGAAAEVGRLVIVEGYTDVIAAHQAGMANVVACLGTALTADHLRLAARYADEIVLAYDADAAGLRAALRDVTMFEMCQSEVKIALLPEGHDPDTLVRSAGVEEFQTVVAGARPVVEFRLERVLVEDGGAEARRSALEAAAEILAQVPDRTRRVDYLDRVADWCGQGDAARTAMVRRALWMEVNRRLARAAREAGGRGKLSKAEDDRDMIVQTVTQCGDGVTPGRQRLERSLLEWAVSDVDLAAYIMGQLTPECFCSPGYATVARGIAEQVASGEFRPHELVDKVAHDAQAQGVLAELLLSDTEAPEDEELVASVQKLRALQTCGIPAMRWEAALGAGGDDNEEGEELGALEALRRDVMQKLDEGEITSDDPLYQQYLRLSQRVHGRGGVEFYEDRRTKSVTLRQVAQESQDENAAGNNDGGGNT